MSATSLTLHDEVKQFVLRWGPKSDKLCESFVWHLRDLMNSYALAALAHGDLPEKGVPHRKAKRKAK